MSFLCGDLILLLSDDVKAVCKNLQAHYRAKVMDTERPGTIRAVVFAQWRLVLPSWCAEGE